MLKDFQIHTCHQVVSHPVSDNCHPLIFYPKTVQLSLQRNASLPISKLPIEILSRIFTLVRASYKWPRSSCWIWISHVCAYWRLVALSDSILWSDIDISRKGLAEAMFLRSRMVPLSVHGQLSEGCSLEMVRLISHNLHRIRYLSISSRFMRFNRSKGFLFPGLSGAAPLLEEAFLNFGCNKASPCLFTLQDSFKLSPHLRTLELSNAYIIWGPHCFLYCTLTLTTLALSRVNSPPLDELLSVFRSLSGLRSVSLLDCLPSGSTMDSLPQFPPVTLKYLEVLKISGPVMDCAAILFHLQHPASTDVFIKGKASIDDSLINREYFSLIAKHFHLELTDPLGTVRTAGFLWEWEDTFKDYLEITVSDQHRQLFRARLQVVYSPETLHHGDSILRQAFCTFFDTFNVFQLTTIEFFGIWSHLPSSVLHACCGTLPNLTVIKADSRHSLDTIWSALGNTSPSSHTLHRWNQQNITHSFPALTTLVIYQGSLIYRDIEKLIRMVKSRHECGAPIVDLKCNWFRSRHVPKLQEYISNPILLSEQSLDQDDYGCCGSVVVS